MTRPGVQVQNVNVEYGSVHALRDVDVAFEPGKVTAVFGPNGAGKTSLFRAISGDRLNFRGSVNVTGSLGYVRQRAVVWDRLTVKEQLGLVAHVSGVTHPKEKVERALADFSLAAWSDRLGKSLSGGTRRRLATALALIHEPAICLLDEPEAGLDLPTRAELYRLMRKWAGDDRIVVFATHHVLSAADVIDHVVMLCNGSIAASGSPQQLISAHASGRRWVVDVDGELEGCDLPFYAFAGRVVVTADASEQSVVETLTACGARVTAIESRESNLEDVFMAVT